MTDKVQKIREEIARIQLYTQSGVLKQILDYIDKVEEEPISKDYRERYKRIAQSESFKEAYDGKSISEEEHSEIDFEQELYKAFGQVKDFTLGMRIAKWFYDMGKNSQEPVSEDLVENATDGCEFFVSVN